MSAPVAIAIAIVLLAANGFFVAAEFALLASRRSRIEQLAADGDRRANSALAGLKELSLMLAGAQLGITMCSLGLGMVGEPAVASVFEGLFERFGLEVSDAVRHTIAFILALGIVVFLHMVVGEMAPKSWAISHPESSALRLIRPFRAFTWVFRPFIKLLNAISNGVIRLVGVQPQDERAMAHAPSDLILLINESLGHGGMDADEHQLLTRSLELSGLDAAAAMTARRDIVSVDATATVTQIEDVARSSGRSRIVVVEGDLDRTLGVLHIKDLLAIDPPDRAGITAATLARPLLVTPEPRRLEDLLLEMREKSLHLALVVDENGTVLGLVTMEDVLEELIGDVEDESDRADGHVRRLAPSTFVVKGSIRPDELLTRTGVEVPEGSWDTLAGFLIHRMDRIPSPGDRCTVDGVTFQVVAVDGYAITEVRVEAAPAPAAVVATE